MIDKRAPSFSLDKYQLIPATEENVKAMLQATADTIIGAGVAIKNVLTFSSSNSTV